MTRTRRRSGAAFAAPLLLLPLFGCGASPARPAVAAAPVADPARSESDAPGSARLSLVPLGRGLPSRSQWRDGFDVADVDGDGVLDVVSGPPRKGARRPGLFLGDGLGAFRFWSEAAFPDLELDYGAAATGDWNGDGLTDVAFAVHLRGLVALVQERTGRFAPYAEGLALRPPAAPAAGSPFSSRTLRAVDWDGDGRTDLVALGEGPGRFGSASAESRGFRVYLNRAGSWETVRPPVAEEEFGVGLAVGDVDGDGHTDAVVTSNVLGSRRILRRGVGSAWTAEELEAVRPNVYVTAVAIARFDRDATADAAVAWLSPEGSGWRHGIDVLLARPGIPGGFERRTLWTAAGRTRITGLDAGDVDGDAFADLVALDDEGTLRVFLREPDGFLVRDVTLPSPESRSGCAGSCVLLRDVDRDGKDDVVASFAGEKSAMDPAGRPCPTGGGIEVWTSAPRP